jgi:hypothetical protein
MACTALTSLGNFFCSIIYTQPVGLLGREISPSQGRYLHKGQQKHRIKTTQKHVLSGTRTHDLVPASDRLATVIGRAPKYWPRALPSNSLTNQPLHATQSELFETSSLNTHKRKCSRRVQCSSEGARTFGGTYRLHRHRRKIKKETSRWKRKPQFTITP